MRKNKYMYATLPIAAAMYALAATSSAQASGACAGPAFGSNPDPSFCITLNANGTTTLTGPAYGPYDGSDDTYVGVINNSNAAVSSIHISSATQPIFGFDGDGIINYGATGNANDSTGYGGPNSYFGNISADFMSGDVFFVIALAANGGSTYFSLEEALSLADFQQVTVGGTPIPAALPLFVTGAGMMGLLARRKKKQA